MNNLEGGVRPMVDVPCWRCGRVLFKVDVAASGRLEGKCARCNAANPVQLEALSDRLV